ncbi:tetratricopeptide repeat protein [Rickettsia endosymbiont of Polydrusus tereticollis]|uniref:tetratricopeptide repeat protein n=1 Tax=Rickettsia endosymbiont of Polydrusus tereticollis TaxID=3066251 RepID=UPI0031334BC3
MKNKTLQDYSEQEETLLASGDLEAMKAFIGECYRQGHTYFERGAFQEAAEFFQYVSVLDPKYLDIYYHMGIAFYKSNNNRQAYIAFKNAIKFDSHNTEIINLMKNVQINLGIEVTEEETDFQRITKNLPQFSSGEGMFLFGQAILEAIQNQETRTQNHEVRIQKTEHKITSYRS